MRGQCVPLLAMGSQGVKILAVAPKAIANKMIIGSFFVLLKRITGSLGIHNEMPGNGMVSKVHVRPLGQVLIQRKRDHDRDLQAQTEPLGGGSFHGVSWRGFTYPGTERVYDGANDYLWQRKMHRRNQVEHVVTIGCNPEEKGYETTVINTCSKSIKALPQLVEACLEKLVMGSSFDTREAVREYLRSITGLDDESYQHSQLKRVRAERKGYSMHDKRVVDMFSMSRPGVSRIPIPRIVKANGVQANHSRFIWQRDETWVLRPRARGLCYGNLDEDARFRDRKSVLTHGRGDLGAGRPPPWAR
ncbi:hypothetical protein DY000_02049064 [Brassica cretica]|uniref:Uncharacterized protein n=1 Tax=Brassica cretica TaxID=69181 RepID=A0ABQ7F8X4_BRACR|nr:hypothetical protein DY000_02049064 [Brassica cretica]